MSRENVELVRTTFDQTLRRGDRIPGAEYFDPGVEFHEDPRLPEAGIYRGVAELLGYWEQFIENWIFTVRDALISRIEAFADREEALEAAGLSE